MPAYVSFASELECIRWLRDTSFSVNEQRSELPAGFRKLFTEITGIRKWLQDVVFVGGKNIIKKLGRLISAIIPVQRGEWLFINIYFVTDNPFHSRVLIKFRNDRYCSTDCKSVATEIGR